MKYGEKRYLPGDLSHLQQNVVYFKMTGFLQSLEILHPSQYCRLGAGSIPLRAIVNKKQCESRGLFMSLVVHY